MFGQSLINQTVRKPDGSTETKQIIRDSSGNVKTTVTRTKNGKTETVTSYGKPGEGGMLKPPKMTEDYGDTGFWMDKNIFVNKNGYALPMNLWWPAVVASTTVVIVVITKLTKMIQIINNYNNILIVFASSMSILSSYYLPLVLLYHYIHLLLILRMVSSLISSRRRRNRNMFFSSFLSLRWNFDIF